MVAGWQQQQIAVLIQQTGLSTSAVIQALRKQKLLQQRLYLGAEEEHGIVVPVPAARVIRLRNLDSGL